MCRIGVGRHGLFFDTPQIFDIRLETLTTAPSRHASRDRYLLRDMYSMHP